MLSANLVTSFLLLLIGYYIFNKRMSTNCVCGPFQILQLTHSLFCYLTDSLSLSLEDMLSDSADSMTHHLGTTFVCYLAAAPSVIKNMWMGNERQPGTSNRITNMPFFCASLWVCVYIYTCLLVLCSKVYPCPFYMFFSLHIMFYEVHKNQCRDDV